MPTANVCWNCRNKCAKIIYQLILLILFGYALIVTNNSVQNAHAVVKLKKDLLEQVKSAILVIKWTLASNAEATFKYYYMLHLINLILREKYNDLFISFLSKKILEIDFKFFEKILKDTQNLTVYLPEMELSLEMILYE